MAKFVPDIARHNPDPDYIRGLVNAIGLTHKEIATRLGLHPDSLKKNLAPTSAATHRPAPYLVQFALEAWAAQSKA